MDMLYIYSMGSMEARVTSKELLELRRRLRVSQAELARLVGIDVNSVARQERGEVEIRPSLERLYILLDHYRDDAFKFLGIEPRRIRRFVRRPPRLVRTSRKP